MGWLIDLLAANPILIVFIAIAVIQAVGGLVARQTRQTLQKRREESRREQLDSFEEGAAAPTSEPTTRSRDERPPPRSAEEIAAEIRRVMGLEDPEPEPEPTPRPVPVPVVAEESVESRHGGDLAQRLSERDRMLSERFAAKEAAGGPRGLRGGPGLGAVGLVGGRDSFGSTYLDLSSPARAFVAMEVLGKPVALREDQFFGD